MVDTAKVAGRRTLRFETIDQLLLDIERIVEADDAGCLRTLGNWTAGQNLAHVAAWIEYGYDGYPMGPPPWFIRLLLKWMSRRYLRRGMPPGLRIPHTEHGTYGVDPMPTRDAADRLRRALQRQKSGEEARVPSPSFGPMSHEVWIQGTLRHAELHLSFLRPS